MFQLSRHPVQSPRLSVPRRACTSMLRTHVKYEPTATRRMLTIRARERCAGEENVPRDGSLSRYAQPLYATPSGTAVFSFSVSHRFAACPRRAHVPVAAAAAAACIQLLLFMARKRARLRRDSGEL